MKASWSSKRGCVRKVVWKKETKSWKQSKKERCEREKQLGFLNGDVVEKTRENLLKGSEEKTSERTGLGPGLGVSLGLFSFSFLPFLSLLSLPSCSSSLVMNTPRQYQNRLPGIPAMADRKSAQNHSQVAGRQRGEQSGCSGCPRVDGGYCALRRSVASLAKERKKKRKQEKERRFEWKLLGQARKGKQWTLVSWFSTEIKPRQQAKTSKEPLKNAGKSSLRNNNNRNAP